MKRYIWLVYVKRYIWLVNVKRYIWLVNMKRYIRLVYVKRNMWLVNVKRYIWLVNVKRYIWLVNVKRYIWLVNMKRYIWLVNVKMYIWLVNVKRYIWLVKLLAEWQCSHWAESLIWVYTTAEAFLSEYSGYSKNIMVFIFPFCRTCVSTQVRYRRAVTRPFVRSSTIDLWAQLLLQFFANRFESSQMFWP